MKINNFIIINEWKVYQNSLKHILFKNLINRKAVIMINYIYYIIYLNEYGYLEFLLSLVKLYQLIKNKSVIKCKLPKMRDSFFLFLVSHSLEESAIKKYELLCVYNGTERFSLLQEVFSEKNIICCFKYILLYMQYTILIIFTQ